MGKFPANSGESYYDFYEDWSLIEASFLKQYGLRIRQNDDMSYAEFCNLLSGLMPDTPLGQIVSIRAEKDSKVIKNMTKEQKKIRREWLLRQAQRRKENPKANSEYWEAFRALAKAAYS